MRNPDQVLNPADQIIEHFYRHEYARLVALLSSRVGVRYLEDIEDAVQFALMTSSHTWQSTELPDHPTAWLYRVATNRLLSVLGQQNNRKRLLVENATEFQGEDLQSPRLFMPGEIRDSLLKMLFLCCDDSLSERSQLVIALKVLCGFQAREIAIHLHASEASIHKRYERARDSLKHFSMDTMDQLDARQCMDRLDAVLGVLYAMFSEGYLSSKEDNPIRKELCLEAIRLATLLADHDFGAAPRTYALLALMHLHLARLETRQDDAGTLLLLEEQDRALWDRQEIIRGLEWLEKSAQGDEYSRFHAEAGIAAEHCIAPSFSETRWQVIVRGYEMLTQLSHKPNAVIVLNHALALAEWKGPQLALRMLEQASPHLMLKKSYIWNAALSDLYRRCGDGCRADEYCKIALEAAPSEAIRVLLKKRLTEEG